MRFVLAVCFVTACGRSGFDAVNDATDANGAIDSTLVGWWTFDEGTGTVAADSSSYGNIGTLIGAPEWVPGKIDTALAFDGVSSYVNAGHAATLGNLAVRTANAWVNVANVGPQIQRIVGKDLGQNCGWDLSIRTGSLVTLHQCFNPTDGVWNVPSNPLPVGEWHHVVVVYNDSDVANQPIIYIDGLPQPVSETQVPIGLVGDESQRDLGIAGNTIDATEDFDGAIDDVRIYARGLTANEIVTLP